MEKFDSETFANALKGGLYWSLPSESEGIFAVKHRKRIGKMRDIALGNNRVIPVLNKGHYFELGNQSAETNTPQYHILEDSEVIHIRGKSTKKSRGSQGILAPQNRDYGQWTISKTKTKNPNRRQRDTIFQEYRKNVRGSRSKLNSARKTYHYGILTVVVNPSSSYYANDHYHYIEKALDGGLLDELASRFGLRRGRAKTNFDLEMAELKGENWINKLV